MITGAALATLIILLRPPGLVGVEPAACRCHAARPVNAIGEMYVTPPPRSAPGQQHALLLSPDTIFISLKVKYAGYGASGARRGLRFRSAAFLLTAPHLGDAHASWTAGEASRVLKSVSLFLFAPLRRGWLVNGVDSVLCTAANVTRNHQRWPLRQPGAQPGKQQLPG